MSVKTLKCLVTITRADVVDSRVVDCIFPADDGAAGYRFLEIPVEDYALPELGATKQKRLRTPISWFAEEARDDYHLVCRPVLDLDKFDELPWVD